MDASRAGVLLGDLGGSRRKVTDTIDPSVGLDFCVRPGNPVEKGDIMVRIHARNREEGERAVRILQDEIVIAESPGEDIPLCRGRILSS